MVGYSNFRTPISFGWGILDGINELIPEGRIFTVLGKGSARDLGLIDRLETSIGREIVIYSGVEPNPSSETVEQGSVRMAESDPDAVLAVGGGSVMDAAKFMALIAFNGGSVMDYLNGEVPNQEGYPVYSVPTTPGTSSEITPFSVVSVKSLGNKIGLRHPLLYPKGAIIDPELTLTLSREQTAATGLDILSHAVESFWSVKSNPLTREMSLKAVSLIGENLENAYEDGSIRETREAISLASVFAGLAFSNTGTTLCHSISYPITFDTGLPHGMAVALTLGPVFELLVEKDMDGLDRLAGSLGTDPASFTERMLDLLSSLGAPTNLKEAGFSGGVERIMSTDLSPLMKNMPVDITPGEVEEIIRKII
jgi:alcohol dehydrogenase class IV